MTPLPADTLRNRTFVGLLIAQFLAAFNDQAIHAAAMFFAINRKTLTAAQAISLMPILFYAPWALFVTLAGYFADRFSKRSALIFWKLVEIGIMAVATLGFWMGTHGNAAGAWVVLSAVFLMGMHSAFFVPAKYGVMPEILQPHMLSRGNGVLESLSFLAVILGTVCGGILSYAYHGREYYIGLILVGLALAGAVASLLAGITLIGFFTGFDLVPLFTLLQHRAPRASKGDSIATSNFINVAGAIAASVVFFSMDWTAKQVGLAPRVEQRDHVAGVLAA